MHNWMLCHNPQKSENDKKMALRSFWQSTVDIVLLIYYKIVNRVKRLRRKNTLKYQIYIIYFYIFILNRV